MKQGAQEVTLKTLKTSSSTLSSNNGVTVKGIERERERIEQKRVVLLMIYE